MKNLFVLIFIFSFLLLDSVNGWSETVEVKIIKSTFIPSVVKVKKGSTIQWVNTEELLHTVTSGKAPQPDGKFNAAYVKKSFKIKLDKEGFYDYYCELHPAIMRGVIIVEDQ